MNMFFLILQISLKQVASVNINCKDHKCSECVSGLNFEKVTCVSICPENYIQSDLSCMQKASSPFIALKLFRFLDVSASKVADFQHPENLQFQDSQRKSPIPTKDRGFYFESSSSLVSSRSWLLAPTFFMSFLVKIHEDGDVLVCTRQRVPFLRVWFNSSEIFFKFPATGFNQTEEITVSRHFETQIWKTLSISVTLSLTNTTIEINNIKTVLPLIEFDSNHELVFHIGYESSSFRGFLQQFLAGNSKFTGFDPIYQEINCDFNQFFDSLSSSCQDCNPVCPTWPWCVRNNTCSICLSEKCDSCTGFDYFHCDSCINSGLAPFCDPINFCMTWDGTNCLECETGFIKIDDLCVVQPYLYDYTSSMPVINIRFDFIRELYGGVFKSGSEVSSFGPFNNSLPDDPFPVLKRGLYFNGTTFLESIIDIQLNYKFSLSFWMNIQDYSFRYLLSSGRFQLTNYFISLIKLSNLEETRLFIVPQRAGQKSSWNFLTLTLDYSNWTQTFSMGSNLVDSFEYSISGYVFYDSPGKIKIGCNEGSQGFVGYIYSFTLWQSAIYLQFLDTFASRPAELWNVEIDQYYNYYEKKAMECNSACSKGCSVWGSCNQCLSLNCSFCDNFNETCLEDQQVQCLDGYWFVNEKCCDLSCLDCFGPGYFRCLDCLAPSVRLGNMCLAQCPSFLTGANCSGDPHVISLKFDRAVPLLADNIHSIQFQSLSSSQFWPHSQKSDPIPAYKRGYFFTSSSVLMSEAISLSHNFTLVFFMKVLKPGVLLIKGNLTISIETLGISLKIENSSNLFIENFDFGVWTVVAFQVFHDMDGFLYFARMHSNNTSVKTKASSFGIHHDIDSGIQLGNGFNTSETFLWGFEVFNSIEAPSHSLSICSSSRESGCLWNCDLGYHLKDSSCELCSSSCQTGCKNSEICNFCEDNECLSCSVENSECFLCGPNSLKNNSKCSCKDGFSRGNNGNCERCPFVFLKFACFDSCPLGFHVKNSSECERNSFDKIVAKFEFFSSLSGVFVDSISGLLCLTGSSEKFYPDLEDNDPVPAYQRGLFFRGNGSLITFFPPFKPMLIFGLEFSVMLWILPASPSTILFQKKAVKYSGFEGLVEDALLKFKILLPNTILSVSFSEPLQLFYWSQIVFTVKNEKELSFYYVTVNKQQSDLSTTKEFIRDSTEGKFVFGSSENFPSFKGFLYSASVFIEELSEDDLSETSQYSGPIVRYSPSVTCDISQYFDYESYSCSSCPDRCLNGCRYNDSCSICADKNCKKCGNYESFSCEICETGFYLYDGECLRCNLSAFFNETSQECNDCPSLCENCLSSNYCTKCILNSHLSQNMTCECNQGFKGFSICEQVYFTVLASISDTRLGLDFSEKLLHDLNKSQVEIYVDEIRTDFDMEKKAEDCYHVKFSSSKTQSSKISVYFLGTIFSISLSVLNTTLIEIETKVEAQNAVVEAIIGLKNSIKYVYLATIGFIIGTSVITFDPNCLFTFLNSAELIAFTSTYTLEMDANLIDFLNNLKISSSLPSFFYDLESKSVNVDEEKLVGYGYSNNLLLDNSGFIISFFITLIFVNILLFALSRICNCRARVWILKLLKYFKYEFYLRLWIQTLFELILTSFISFRFFMLGSAFQIGNLIITVLIIVSFTQITQIILFASLCLIVNKRRKLRNLVEIESLLDRFGIFFDEFSTGPVYKYLFYIIFFIRRLILCTFVVFSHSGGFQIIISLIFSFIVRSSQVILFTRLSSCFKDRYFDKYFFTSELLIAVFYFCQGLFALHFVSPSSLAVTGYSIVFIILFITIIFGTSSSIIKIWRTCRKSRRSTKVVPAKYEERENNHEQSGSFNGLCSSINQKSEFSRQSGAEFDERELKRYFSFRFAPNASLRDSAEGSVHIQ